MPDKNSDFNFKERMNSGLEELADTLESHRKSMIYCYSRQLEESGSEHDLTRHHLSECRKTYRHLISLHRARVLAGMTDSVLPKAETFLNFDEDNNVCRLIVDMKVIEITRRDLVEIEMLHDMYRRELENARHSID